VGLAAALFFAFRPVDGSGTGADGCGQPAISTVLDGTGANQQVGSVRRGYHTRDSQCYNTAKDYLIVAGGCLLAPFVLTVLAVSAKRARERESYERVRRTR
jgi:hypothetical protein